MNKILSGNEALKEIKKWQQTGHEIVFTNGCFDLLHVGHVRYLKASAALGQKLVVALNSDASVKKLKGSGRPVNKLEDRMEVLAALEFVDLVTHFEEETPLQLISLFLPDIITKGGDYTIDTIVGADIVIENGGSVEIIDFEKGYSTTSMLNAKNSH